MSFIYPRTITISRPFNTSGVGALPYQGLDPSDETVIATGIIASIQKESSVSLQSGLPGDVASGSEWAIFFVLPNGTLLDRDIITDDLGERYQVMAAYWNSLGYKAICERLQT
jgi:hypothetical protein